MSKRQTFVMKTGTLAFSNRLPQEERRAGMVSSLPRLPLFKAHIVCETEAHHPAPEAGYLRQLSSALGTCLYFRTHFYVASYLGSVLFS